MPNDRHSSHCGICRHPQREEIESEFLRWRSPRQIASEFRLGSRQSVFRHARTLGLFARRAENVRGIFLAIIEHGMASRMRPTPSTVVQAAVALSKLDTEGRSVERVERVNSDAAVLDDPRWTVAEMEAFAREGTWPDWYRREHPVTAVREIAADELPN